MPTLMQKIRLALRGWQRRRQEADQAFVAKNASWGKAPVAATPPASPGPVTVATKPRVDLEGLQVAYLDESGQIDYYLDTKAGDVVEVRESARNDAMPASFRRVPRRTAQSDADDRSAFATTIESTVMREVVSRAAADATAFRRAISEDRAVERAWYNFKNDRASAVIEAWLRTAG